MYAARAVVLGQMLQPRSQRQWRRDPYGEAAARVAPDQLAAAPSLVQGARRFGPTRVVAAAALIAPIANFSLHLIDLLSVNRSKIELQKYCGAFFKRKTTRAV